MLNLDLPIIFDDGEVMVVNKPPGVVVNKARTTREETVQDWVERKLRIFTLGNAPSDPPLNLRGGGGSYQTELFVKRSGIAHRLDKETSGCLLIAKTPEALTNLLWQFKARIIKKEYLALVHGHLRPGEGTIRLPLRRSRFDRERWEVHYGGKMAETGWKVEKYFFDDRGQDLSLIRLFPLTGRTHQIRVHLAHLGHPIYSDEKYLTKSRREHDRSLLKHHFLHAERIKFRDGLGQWREVKADLPQTSLRLLSLIENG